MNTGKEFIESIKKGDYQHKALDISLYLTAPVFLIPESIFYPQRPCLIIDTGSITLESYLVPFTKDVKYKEIKDASCIYDRYVIGLQNF